MIWVWSLRSKIREKSLPQVVLWTSFMGCICRCVYTCNISKYNTKRIKTNSVLIEVALDWKKTHKSLVSKWTIVREKVIKCHGENWQTIMGNMEGMLIHMEELENTSAASEKWVWRKCNRMKSDKKLKSYKKATVRTTDSTRTKKKAFWEGK